MAYAAVGLWMANINTTVTNAGELWTNQ